MASNSSGHRDSIGTDGSSVNAALKVPIPRIRKNSAKPRDEAVQHRVSHACEPCRQRKTKCSGERPICKHCQDFKINCYYADGKRDRAKNEMINLKTRIDIYENLLQQLKAQVDSAGQLAITKALQGLRVHDNGSHNHEHIRDGESLVSAEVGSTGSIDHIKEDYSENTPYPTGYMGKSSEVAWIQRVAQQLAEEADNSPMNTSRKSSFSGQPTRGRSFDSAVADEEYQFQTPAYHLDDLSITAPPGVEAEPAFLLPDRKVADQLLNIYFTTFYPSFPIVSKKTFMNQYNHLYEVFFPQGSHRWMAMLNLKFAIGALYAKLINADWRGEDTDHLKYFARARLLYLNDNSVLEVADLQQVQLIGLTGMYLLASNQTNRAWHVIGLAIRYAQTLGLNLRSDVQSYTEVEKELRVRMWYALYSIEYILCFMTGRPASIRNKDCSVPLPRPIDDDIGNPDDENAYNIALKQCSEEAMMTPQSSNSNLAINSTTAFASSSNSCTPSHASGSNPRTPQMQTPDGIHLSVGHPPNHGNHASASSSRSPFSHSTSPTMPLQSSYAASYFLEHTKLNKITASVLSRLYSPDTINRSWSDIQGTISALELSVVKWRADLPAIWDFGNIGRASVDQPFVRERMSLAFQYHNARILINRPCLCRLDYRIPNESNRSRGFNRSAAATCVQGARDTVALLPDNLDPIALISITPWWCLLHYLVSAGAILMVEISMRAEHNPQQAEGLLADAKKVVRWLRAMSHGNVAAERSWAVLSKLLIVSAPKIGGDTSDVERDLEDIPKGTPAAPQQRTSAPSMLPPGMQAQPQVQMAQLFAPRDEGLSDLFRGVLDDHTFPFGNIPIHSPFDNLMVAGYSHPSPHAPGMSPHHPGVSPHQQLSPVPQVQQVQVQQVHSPQVQAVTTAGEGAFGGFTMVPQGQHSQDQVGRLQKRLSRGVGQISMPPPMKFWGQDEFPQSPQSPKGRKRGV